MGMSVQLRGIGVAVALFGLSALGPVVAMIGTAGTAVAQMAVRIDVEGNRRVEPDTIRAYFRVGPGERLDASKIDSALKGLYATGLFQDVRITPGPGRILVTVVENPVINRVAFEGNKKAKDDQLNQEVQSKPRGTYSRATVQSDVQRILEVYQHSGRYDVSVDPKIIELPNGQDRRRQDHFHRQQGILQSTPQGRHQDRRDEFSKLPEVERHLRSRPG
jgi:outer membrane protein insertion porin family